jgi:hypothetical protein
VEKSPPFVTVCRKLDDAALRYGYLQAEKLIQQYRECAESGRWPGYSETGYPVIALPAWEQKEAEHFA